MRAAPIGSVTVMVTRQIGAHPGEQLPVGLGSGPVTSTGVSSSRVIRLASTPAWRLR